jgi:hypothetical protein
MKPNLKAIVFAALSAVGTMSAAHSENAATTTKHEGGGGGPDYPSVRKLPDLGPAPKPDPSPAARFVAKVERAVGPVVKFIINSPIKPTFDPKTRTPGISVQIQPKAGTVKNSKTEKQPRFGGGGFSSKAGSHPVYWDHHGPI